MNADQMNLESPLARGRTAEIYEWGDDRVLKLFRPGWAADDAEYEAEIGRQVHASGLPVPAVFELVTVAGRPGITLERVSGPTMLTAIQTRPWAVQQYANVLAELHVEMHRQEIPNLPLQRPRLQDRIERQAALPPPLKAAILELLARLPEENRLCHGDFHPDNIVLTTSGPVIIDWIDATAGHPLADVARTSLLSQIARIPLGFPVGMIVSTLRGLFHRRYLARYFQLSQQPQQELQQWLAPIAATRMYEGIAGEEERLVQIVERALA